MLGNDPLTKMLCGMLGVKPEELQATIVNLGNAATWFKSKIEYLVTKADENAAALKRIEDALSDGTRPARLLLANSGGSGDCDGPAGSDNGNGGNAAVAEPGNFA